MAPNTVNLLTLEHLVHISRHIVPTSLWTTSIFCVRAMDLARLLSHDPPKTSRTLQAVEHSQHEPQRLHQYPTRHSVVSHNAPSDIQQNVATSIQHYGNNMSDVATGYGRSPGSGNPKSISFELPLDSGTNHKARLPMRVLIHPHDTTESIITTVKNFYGLYGGATQSVSFEDAEGNILIPRYENLGDGMTVYVRVMSDYAQAWQSHNQMPNSAGSPVRAHRLLDEGLQMLPPQPAQILNYGEPDSRPASRVARKKSASPRPSRSRRSVSAQKARSRSGLMSREDSFQGHLTELNSDTARGYSSSDGEGGSVTSSRKARSEQVVNADISLDNVLEGNRRKKAKFESSVSLARTLTDVRYTNYSISRNCHFLFHLKCQQQIPSPRSLPRGDPMVKTTLLRSRDRLNVPLHTTNPFNRHRAMDLGSTHMASFHRLGHHSQLSQ